jgi:Glycosyl transferase family 2
MANLRSRLKNAWKSLKAEGVRSVASHTWDVVNSLETVDFTLRGLILPMRVRHMHGPKRVVYNSDELIVICVVRNGELYVDSFLKHYKDIGVKHFVFLDNGSTDGTLEILCSSKNVTVLTTLVPYRRYENSMKRYLAKRFAKGRWVLCADIDELFEYPSSDRISLGNFLSYLNSNGFNGVITQMLDMFSDVPLTKISSRRNDDIRLKHQYYDLSAIKQSDYTYARIPNPKIKEHKGGIRRIVFGTNNGLTKVSLFKMDGELTPFVGWHHARRARMADISCVLLHYPFVSSFMSKVKDATQTDRYAFPARSEYQAYHRAMNEREVCLKKPTARKLLTVDELVEVGFIAVSNRYSEWLSVQAYSEGPSSLSRALARD